MVPLLMFLVVPNGISSNHIPINTVQPSLRSLHSIVVTPSSDFRVHLLNQFVHVHFEHCSMSQHFFDCLFHPFHGFFAWILECSLYTAPFEVSLVILLRCIPVSTHLPWSSPIMSELDFSFAISKLKDLFNDTAEFTLYYDLHDCSLCYRRYFTLLLGTLHYCNALVLAM